MIRFFLNAIIPTATPQKFTEEAMGVARELGLETELVDALCFKVKPPGGKDVTVYLDNAYTNYRTQKWSRRKIIRDHLEAMSQIDEEETLIPARIIPTIKDKSYVQETRAHLSKNGGQPEDFFVVEEYNEALDIVYAVDSPKSIRYLNPKDLPELNLHGQTLRDFAIDNLKSLLPAVEVHGAAPCLMLQAGGMFESSLLLFERAWDKKQLGIQGDIVVAVPARDVVLVADSAVPESIARVQKLATKVVGEAAYRLCDQLFVRQDGRFVPYVPNH